MQCGICYTDVDSCITCPACEYKACKACLSQYFSTRKEPNCASCGVVFTRDFLARNVPSFLKTYKGMREKLLLEVEMAKMPETQVAVAREKRKREIKEEITETREMMQEMKRRLDVLSEDYRRLDRPTGATGDSASVAEPVAGVKTICRCPATDCRGFVTEAEHKCGLCGLVVCGKCMMAEGEEEEHTCKKEDLESAELMKKSSKPCPKCVAPIFKIDGCDQMWCTLCKTAFSWKTGQVETGRIHNPHFFEWQRKMHGGEAPRVQGDEPPPRQCGRGLMSYHELLHILKQLPADEAKKLRQYHEYAEHIRANQRVLAPVDNTELRVSYLLGKIDQKQLSKRLQQVDKLFQKKTEVNQVFETVSEASASIFEDLRALWRRDLPAFKLRAKEFHEKLVSLYAFGDTQLKEIAAKYQMVTPDLIGEMHQYLGLQKE
jgi:hypothetical protein